MGLDHSQVLKELNGKNEFQEIACNEDIIYFIVYYLRKTCLLLLNSLERKHKFL